VDLEVDTMKVFTIAGPKGGCGKSVATASLAVRALKDAGRVAIVDLDEDQGTLTEWWTLRGRRVDPFLKQDGGRSTRSWIACAPTSMTTASSMARHMTKT
jgi:cellulose biosynthesis protein BcsQ